MTKVEFRRFLSFAIAAPCLAHCATGAEPTASLTASDPLFTYDGKDVAVGELPMDRQNEVYRIEETRFKALRKIAQDAVIDRYAQEEAKRQGRPVDKVRAELLRATPPTEAELHEVYDANRARLHGSYDAVKEELRTYLVEQKTTDKRDKLVRELMDRKSAALRLDLPLAPTAHINTAPYPVMNLAANGSAGEPVEFVEFIDYRCGHCREVEDAVRQAASKLGRPVKLVAVDFPHVDPLLSPLLAKGAYCAKSLGVYERYRAAALDFEGTKDDVYRGLAKSLGVADGKWRACLDSFGAQAYLQTARAERMALGVSATPVFFLEGRRLESLEALSSGF